MRTAKHFHHPVIVGLITAGMTMLVSAAAQNITPACSPTIIANQVVATPQQREAAGDIAEPPLTDQANGFAWSDTAWGVVKTDQGYLFFCSDGALHSRQQWQGRWYGNNKYGSINRFTLSCP